MTTKHRELPSLAGAIGALTGKAGLRYAAARRGTFRSVRELMADHGIEALSGGSRKDGADRVLLAQAHVLSRTGVGAFIVVSNDRRFSQLATVGVLHVLTLDAAQLSSRLLARATSVNELVASGGRWNLVPVALDRGGLTSPGISGLAPDRQSDQLDRTPAKEMKNR